MTDPVPECLVCGEGLRLDGAVLEPLRATIYCTDCGTPHHRDCFQYGGKCAVYGCGGLRYSLRGPHERDVVRIEVGKPGKPADTRAILDLETPLEWAVTAATLLGLAFTIVLAAIAYDPHFQGGPHHALTAVSAALTLILFMVRRSTDCYYVIDTTSRQVLYHRSFVGISRNYPIANFASVLAIELVARRRWRSGNKYRAGRFYTELVLELVDSRDVRWIVADHLDEPYPGNDGGLETRGRDAAALIGCAFREVRRPYDAWNDGAGIAALGIPFVYAVGTCFTVGFAWAPTALYVFFAWPFLAGMFQKDDQ